MIDTIRIISQIIQKLINTGSVFVFTGASRFAFTTKIPQLI